MIILTYDRLTQNIEHPLWATGSAALSIYAVIMCSYDSFLEYYWQLSGKGIIYIPPLKISNAPTLNKFSKMGLHHWENNKI